MLIADGARIGALENVDGRHLVCDVCEYWEGFTARREDVACPDCLDREEEHNA